MIKSKNCVVKGFLDDNIMKQGLLCDGLKILSHEALKNNIQKHKDKSIAIVLGSIYVGMLLTTLSAHGFYEEKQILVVDMGSLIAEKDEEGTKKFIKTDAIDQIMGKIPLLYDICTDEESHRVIDVMKKVYQNEYFKQDVYSAICSREPQYFIEEVLEILGDRPLTIVSGGAYHGEIIGDLIRYDLNVKKLWLFEADKTNYDVMQENIQSVGWENKCVAVNRGLWNSKGKLYMAGEGDTCKIVDEVTDNSIEVTSLNEIIGHEKVDFIETDIEGAEQFALQGARKIIMRDRPVLAITIYHSPEDFVEIPRMLHKWLDSYKFMIKHHTNVYVESILYAIPKEHICGI